jgi:hypothetical protein
MIKELIKNKMAEDNKEPKSNIVYNEAIEETLDVPTAEKQDPDPGKGKGDGAIVYNEGSNADITFDNRVGIDLEDYAGYLGNDIYMPDQGGIETLNKSRALNQSGWEQAGSMLGQAVVGEIVGGTIEGLGYILDVGSALDYMSGDEADWGNFLTEAGKGLRTWGQEAMPIHQVNPGKFDPSDAGWWYGNGVSVASTLSMLLPSMAATKALGFLGKGASRLAGRFSKVLDVAENMGKKATWMTEGVSQAIVSRHIENSMEASGTFESAKADYLTRIDKETGLPFSEDKATQLASEAAASNYRAGWAMLLQDIPQYLALGKIFNPVSGKMENALSKAANGGKKVAIKPWVSKAKAVGYTFASEGFEESYQYYIAERGKALADLNAGLIDRHEYNTIMDEAIGSDEMKTSAFFGGLGGNVFQFAGKGVNEIGKGKKRRSYEKNYETVYRANLNDRAKAFMGLQIELADADQAGDVDRREAVLDQMMVGMTIDALNRGKFDEHIDALEGVANMTAEEKAKFAEKGTEFNSELANKLLPNLLEQAGEIREDYLRLADKYEANIAAKMASNNHNNKRMTRHSAKLAKKAQALTNSMPEIDQLTPFQRENVDNAYKRLALAGVLKSYKLQLKDSTERQKPNIEKLIKDTEAELASVTAKVISTEGDTRDAETKANDKRISDGFGEIKDELVAAIGVKKRNEGLIWLNQKENEAVKSAEYRAEFKKEAAKDRIDQRVQTQEDVIEEREFINNQKGWSAQEKTQNLQFVADKEKEISEAQLYADEQKKQEAIHGEKIDEVNKDIAEKPTKVNNRNTAPIADNIEDEFADEEGTTVEDKQRGEDKSLERKVNKGYNIKVPKFENLWGPGWKAWLFNGKNKKDVKLEFVVGNGKGANDKAQQAIKIFEEAKNNPKVKLTDIEKEIMFNYLPIKVQLNEDIYAWLPGYTKTNKFFEANEYPKRKAIIRALFQGKVETQITHQFGGNLHVQETDDHSVPW